MTEQRIDILAGTCYACLAAEFTAAVKPSAGGEGSPATITCKARLSGENEAPPWPGRTFDVAVINEPIARGEAWVCPAAFTNVGELPNLEGADLEQLAACEWCGSYQVRTVSGSHSRFLGEQEYRCEECGEYFTWDPSWGHD